MANEDLMHHGVKGMKWGVTRKRPSDRKVTRKIAKQNFKERDKLHTLSSDELKRRVERVNLENNYIQATAKNVQLTRSRGAKAVSKFSQSNYGKQILKSSASAVLAKGAASATNPAVASGLGIVSAATAVGGKKK